MCVVCVFVCVCTCARMYMCLCGVCGVYLCVCACVCAWCVVCVCVYFVCAHGVGGVCSRGRGNGPAAPVLARLVFLKVKMKVHFTNIKY